VANNSGGALGDETHEVHTPPIASLSSINKFNLQTK
jgi:hypothetical protein